jgi:hypothetical protein
MPDLQYDQKLAPFLIINYQLSSINFGFPNAK